MPSPALVGVVIAAMVSCGAGVAVSYPRELMRAVLRFSGLAVVVCCAIALMKGGNWIWWTLLASLEAFFIGFALGPCIRRLSRLLKLRRSR